MKEKVHVAVGVIQDKSKRFLISKRLDSLHQGGLWEFPGGKLESSETVYDALCRELHEELNLHVQHAVPLIQISHQYIDKYVLLDVWLVDDFDGTAESQQQQDLKWVSLSDLKNYTFPAANSAILKCLRLPEFIAITGHFQNTDDYIQSLKNCLDTGMQLIQLRYKTSNTDVLLELAKKSMALCTRKGAKLIVNADVDFLELCDVDGIHLNSKRLSQYSERPISLNKLLSASVHNKEELLLANKINVDFVVISPVFETTSHPDASVLNWQGLKELVSYSNVPIFALGGMKVDMLPEVKQSGAYGLAGITEFWK